MFPRNYFGIPWKQMTVLTDAFDIQLLYSCNAPLLSKLKKKNRQNFCGILRKLQLHHFHFRLSHYHLTMSCPRLFQAIYHFHFILFFYQLNMTFPQLFQAKTHTF